MLLWIFMFCSQLFLHFLSVDLFLLSWPPLSHRFICFSDPILIRSIEQTVSFSLSYYPSTFLSLFPYLILSVAVTFSLHLPLLSPFTCTLSRTGMVTLLSLLLLPKLSFAKLSLACHSASMQNKITKKIRVFFQKIFQRRDCKKVAKIFILLRFGSDSYQTFWFNDLSKTVEPYKKRKGSLMIKLNPKHFVIDPFHWNWNSLQPKLRSPFPACLGDYTSKLGPNGQAILVWGHEDLSYIHGVWLILKCSPTISGYVNRMQVSRNVHPQLLIVKVNLSEMGL